MLEYLKAYGHIPFSEAPLNDVDRLVFAQCAYLNFAGAAGVRGRLLAEALIRVSFDTENAPSEQRFAFQHRDDLVLCSILRESRRFGDVIFRHFANGWDRHGAGQFAALTVELPDGRLLIAFRGTDNTISGWKEDFDLAFKEEVPAQQMAVLYVEQQSKGYDRVELCGHSKGGHLAFYAAAACHQILGERLMRAVSFDGPGLSEKMVKSEGFLQAQGKMRLLRPRSSLVGLLFYQPVEDAWVECRLVSIMQHYPYSWKTEGMDFQYAAGQSLPGEKLGQTVVNLLEKLDLDTREKVVETVYELIAATGATTVRDLFWIGGSGARALLRKLRETDRETYLLVLKVIRIFWQSVGQALGLRNEEKIDKK